MTTSTDCQFTDEHKRVIASVACKLAAMGHVLQEKGVLTFDEVKEREDKFKGEN